MIFLRPTLFGCFLRNLLAALLTQLLCSCRSALLSAEPAEGNRCGILLGLLFGRIVSGRKAHDAGRVLIHVRALGFLRFLNA
ncbi:MAG: hypothetical protein IH897_08975 [Planctomycetes bacterium]|nr:hypothetical protein [Planctomycetota bacterium]MCH8242728.1 hypothetical protein [Planctomycetota bacterium]